jgi:hypothetical protein
LNPPPLNIDLSKAGGATQLPWLNWISQLNSYARTIGQSGTTAQRPASGNFIGQTFFDTTLGTMVAVASLNPTTWVALGGSGGGTVTGIGSTTLTIGGTATVPTVNLSGTQVANIAAGGTALQSVAVANSITGTGVAGTPIQLSGDAASPGNSYYYGTNNVGTKGFFTLPSVPVSANPSAKVGLSAVNGVAATFMTSDSAPQLDVSISPTWTGIHTFQPSGAGVAISIVMSTAANGLIVEGFGTTPSALFKAGAGGHPALVGLVDGQTGTRQWTLSAGRTAVGQFDVWDETAGVSRLSIDTSGNISGYGATAAALVSMTPDTGSFTATLTGCTTSPTATCVWVKFGNLVCLTLGAVSATSNSTTTTLTGLPALLQAARQQNLSINFAEDNTAATNATVSITNSGTINLYKGASTSGTSWTAAGTKGLTANNTVTYLIN